MPALRELQTLFKASLLAGDEEAAIQQIEGDGLDPRARLAVYRHHILTTLTAVLESAYPVVCRLVDRRFFAYAADAFIRRQPPESSMTQARLADAITNPPCTVGSLKPTVPKPAA